MHKTKQKRYRNITTTSLVLDSSMLRGRRKFRLKPANLVAFKLSIFKSRRISFLKIFLVVLLQWPAKALRNRRILKRLFKSKDLRQIYVTK